MPVKKDRKNGGTKRGENRWSKKKKNKKSNDGRKIRGLKSGQAGEKWKGDDSKGEKQKKVYREYIP